MLAAGSGFVRAAQPIAYVPLLSLEAKPVVVGYGQSQVWREAFLEGRFAVDVTVAGVVLKRPSVLVAAKHKPNIGLGVLRRFTVVWIRPHSVTG